MNRRMRVQQSCLALAITLLVGLLGAAHMASAHPIGQASDPIATVMALVDAYNNADVAKLDALLGPSFTAVILNPPPPLVQAETLQIREQFKNNASENALHITASN